MTNLFKVQGNELVAASAGRLSRESQIEDWVERNPALLGLDAMIIGRQVPTAHGKYIDLVAMDREGTIIIIELKKDKTARDIVGQVLDYASWIKTLSTADIYKIAEQYTSKHLTSAYSEYFNENIPEQLNSTHSMLIVASELDPSSRRIVEYLSEEHGVAINTAFFNVFEHDGGEWLTTDFLLDQAAVEERSERKVKAPWSGYYFVNAGIGEDRGWTDMVRYGFIGASGGSFYTKRLDQLKPGDKVFVYDKGNGYIGYGIVNQSKVRASEFSTENGPLFSQPLEQPNIKLNAEDSEIAEYVVGIDWSKTFDVSHAKRFKGAFANQNIVCKLRDQATIEFLIQAFEVNE
ncbi:endonuclease NucS domain-containing protein [Henriciella litoralis]|uniref:endonuclease NucS domain-containing protein n=1 Tax=Henriciella litoralis TaxID=568102 RepID=UPI000A06B3C2|nr:endonuclease NucS domain-containing protein [Henriciella litoralis]